MKAIIIQGLTLAFGEHSLLADFDFFVPRGQWLALLGRSGCGKSTLLKAIAGLEHGATQRGDIVRASSIAYMAQQDSLLPWLSVVDNVQLGNYLTGVKNAASKDNALQLLEKVQLSEHGKKFPYELSGGQRQRAALARTLMQTADIVLMDEPFSAVDAITRLELQRLAAELLADKTVILITHDPLEAIRLADSIYIMHDGKLSHAFVPNYPRPRLEPHQSQPELQQQLQQQLLGGR